MCKPYQYNSVGNAQKTYWINTNKYYWKLSVPYSSCIQGITRQDCFIYSTMIFDIEESLQWDTVKTLCLVNHLSAH